MRLTQHIVVGIVCRSHLQTTRTELDIHIAILNHRNHPVHQWHNHLLALQPLGLRVFRVHTHRRIAHDGLRTSGSHYCIIALGILVNHIALTTLVDSILEFRSHIVFQIEQMTLLFLIDHLFSRECRQCLGIPVHHTQTTIDVALVIQVNKHLDNTLATLLVHCECRTVPIARCTQLAQLFQDDATVLMCPRPGMLQELLTCQVALLDTLASQFLHHLSLSSNRSVVGTWYPTSVLALHAGTTHQDILYGIVQHMSHVQHTCHIRWWNHDGIRLSSIGFRTKKLMVSPILIPFPLHFCGTVLTC